VTCWASAECNKGDRRRARKHAATNFHARTLPFEAVLCGKGRALRRRMLSESPNFDLGSKNARVDNAVGCLSWVVGVDFGMSAAWAYSVGYAVN
jgi:hypothetical protein